MIISASDIEPISYCARRYWYDHNPPAGLEEADLDPFDMLVIEMGLEHEQSVRQMLAETSGVEEAQSLDHTQELMSRSVPVIYQAQLLDKGNQLFGKPDFLIRCEDGAYQAADAKLARSVDKEIGIQVAFYRRILGNENPGVVYLGTGEVATVGSEYDDRLNMFIIESRSVLENDSRPLVRYSETKCSSCSYYPVCHPEFVANEELTLLYGVDRRSLPRLEEHGISTISDLAEANPDVIPDVPYLKGQKKHRAVAQAHAWKTGKMTKFNDIVMPPGTWVHFDIEANPLASSGQLHVYLWGFLKPPYHEVDFDFVWTDGEENDEAGWRQFLLKIEDYRVAWPDIKLVHYSSYERIKIAEYANRYEMGDHPTVAWILDREAGPLYDIQDAVTDNLVLPLPGYGLKNICKHPDLVNFQWQDEGSGSQWSVVQYVKYLRCHHVDERKAIKNVILTYNRDDVVATRRLEEWLRSL